MPTPPLRTDRLDLEPLAPRHADEMVDVLADRRLYAFYDDEPSPTLEQLRARYERQSLGRSPDGDEAWHNWILRERATGAAVGFVQATVRRAPVDDGRSTAELAWVVGIPWQGRGYASEAAAAVRDALLSGGTGDELVTAVLAHIAPGHAASESVARRIGLAPTEELHDGERLWRGPVPPHGG